MQAKSEVEPVQAEDRLLNNESSNHQVIEDEFDSSFHSMDDTYSGFEFERYDDASQHNKQSSSEIIVSGEQTPKVVQGLLLRQSRKDKKQLLYSAFQSCSIKIINEVVFFCVQENADAYILKETESKAYIDEILQKLNLKMSENVQLIEKKTVGDVITELTELSGGRLIVK